MQAKARPTNTQLLSQHLAKHGYMEIESVGDSMYPLIREGNLCRFEPVGLGSIRQGDILLFVTDEGRLVGHRYLSRQLERGDLWFVCKGDANGLADAPIRADQIIGRLTLIRTAPRKFIRIEGMVPYLWGRLIVRFPELGRFIRKWLSLNRRIRRRFQLEGGKPAGDRQRK